MLYIKNCFWVWLLLILTLSVGNAQNNTAGNTAATRVKIANGLLQGTTRKSGVRVFKGIPFAAPPVGEFRWKPPQPAKNWTGVRKANQFGPRAMQLALFGDMNFRSNGMSEDCLYLNVWTPAKSGQERRAVLVYFYGGGFVAGDGSEPRYDGESMAGRGIVAVTVNYRLGVFGFMAHPELTKESPKKASGNYGLLDQAAALRWVKKNIGAFGGDPNRITIAGESAGSISVSAHMASPLSKNLIAGAIGESGSLLSLQRTVGLGQAEEVGVNFANSLEAESLADLRALSATRLLEVTRKPGSPRFPVTVDGYFLPKPPADIFAAGEQAHVPLMAGWNSEESNYRAILGQEPPTPENYVKAVKKFYGEDADTILELYPGTNEAEVLSAATALASDRFIGYSTWKWIDVHSKTGGKPVYRYFYSWPRPELTPEMGNAIAGLAGGVIQNPEPAAQKAPPASGAVHSAEIEYALGNLRTNKVYAWTPEDYTVSKIMQSYFVRFIKTGNPNGKGLLLWPPIKPGKAVPVMQIDIDTRVVNDFTQNRYLLLQKLRAK